MSQTLSRDGGLRRPQQLRSTRTMNRILNAAERILARRGLEGLRIQDLVSRAGCSVGAFYKRFKNKEALLRVLFDRLERDVAESVRNLDRPDGSAPPDLEEAIRQLIGFCIHLYRTRRGLLRLLLARAQSRPHDRRRARRIFTFLSEWLEPVIRARAGEISHEDPLLAADFALRQLIAILDQELLFSGVPPTRIPLPDDRLAREIERCFLAYFGSAPRRTTV